MKQKFTNTSLCLYNTTSHDHDDWLSTSSYKENHLLNYF